MKSFRLPGSAPAVVAAEAPGAGPQFWAGAPCAVLDEDGTYVVGYRVRNGPDSVDQTVIARSDDGERLTTVLTLDQDHFGAQWTERPALVRTAAGWRMFVGCATPGTKHWRIAAAEAKTLEGLAAAEIRTAFAGDEQTGVKDPIVRLSDGVWQAWICCHPLDIPDAEDRMSTAYATSADGWNWDWHGTVPGCPTRRTSCARSGSSSPDDARHAKHPLLRCRASGPARVPRLVSGLARDGKLARLGLCARDAAAAPACPQFGAFQRRRVASLRGGSA